MKKPARAQRRRPRLPRPDPSEPREQDERGQIATRADVRLQRFLASAGLGSRRQCEQLIIEGRVEVDGRVVDVLGSRVRPYQQKICVDGTRLRPSRRRYFVVNKPVGVLCTHRDPGGRTRVIDLLPAGERYFTVGRLDRSSEGLILVTNDGDLANGLAHPRYGVAKTYRVELAGHVNREGLAQFRSGIRLAEGVAHVDDVHVVKQRRQSTLIEMVLREGKNREIRRMAARLGHKVLSLQRIAIGSLRLAELPVGAFRELSSEEVKRLYAMVANRGERGRGRGRPRPGASRRLRAGARGGPRPRSQGRPATRGRVSR